jgi:uncharacterized membrane protein
MKRIGFQEIIVWIVILMPVIYFLKVFNSLPDKVPFHYNFSGEPDSFTNKGKVWITVGSVALISAFCYLLIKNLARIDPKKTARISQETSVKIAVGVVFLSSAINFGIIYSTIHGHFALSKMMNPLMGLFFIYVGNLMHSLKPNYFVGLRIPWTLENEDNWRATHRLGSKIWVAGGLFMLVSGFLLPENIGQITFVVCTALMVIIPSTYSFIYFKKHQKIT